METHSLPPHLLYGLCFHIQLCLFPVFLLDLQLSFFLFYRSLDDWLESSLFFNVSMHCCSFSMLAGMAAAVQCRHPLLQPFNVRTQHCSLSMSARTATAIQYWHALLQPFNAGMHCRNLSTLACTAAAVQCWHAQLQPFNAGMHSCSLPILARTAAASSTLSWELSRLLEVANNFHLLHWFSKLSWVPVYYLDIFSNLLKFALWSRTSLNMVNIL